MNNKIVQLFLIIIFVYDDVNDVWPDIVRDDNVWLDSVLLEPVQHRLVTSVSTLRLH